MSAGVGIRSAVARAVPGRAFAALMRAIYPRIEVELARVAAWAPRGGTAVDVGAWYGPWTARLLRLADRVVTIAANPDLARLVRASFPAAQVVEAAASDRGGTAQLWLPAGGRGAGGTASLEHNAARSPTCGSSRWTSKAARRPRSAARSARSGGTRRCSFSNSKPATSGSRMSSALSPIGATPGKGCPAD